MALAALAFTLMLGAVKVARAELSAFEVIFWRACISLPIAGLLCLRNGLSGFKLHNRKVFALRAMFGFGAMSGFYTAAKGLSVADLSLLTKLQPIWIAIAAPIVVGRSERVGPSIWWALALGLVGCAVLVGPEFAVGSLFGLIAVVASLGSGAAHLAVRVLTKTDKPEAIVFWFQVALLFFAAGTNFVTQGGPPQLPPPSVWWPVLLCGLFAICGQLLMTNAYRKDRAPIVAAVAYTGPLWAALIDLVYFGVTLDLAAAIGGLMVLSAGVILLREAR